METSPRLLRSLQVFAVLLWVFFWGLDESPQPEDPGSVCLVALLLASLGGAWFLVVLYLVWLYGDRNTPRAGGRRSWVRNWAIWRHFCDYFPISLVKTTELDPSLNYLFGFHPHGVLVVGAFGNFCTEAVGFSHLFPGPRPHLLKLPCWFQIPIFRDYILTSGLVSSDKASGSYLLSGPGGGQVAVLTVGGPLEALEAKPGILSLRIRNQKGFIKGLGERALPQFPNPRGSWVRRAQEALQSLLSVALPLFHGRLGLRCPSARPSAPSWARRFRCSEAGSPAVRRWTRCVLSTQLFEHSKQRYGVPADRSPFPSGTAGGQWEQTRRVCVFVHGVGGRPGAPG